MHLRLCISILLITSFLTACIGPQGMVKYDPKQTPVHKIGLVTFNAPPKYFYHDLKNNGGAIFGIVGAVASGVVESSEQEYFATTLQKQNFDVLKYFSDQLISSMQASGFQVETLSDLSKDPNFLLKPEELSVSPPVDAIMDIKFTHLGIASTTGPFSQTELKPVVEVIVTLISPVTKTIIYRETVAYGKWNAFSKYNFEADEQFTWDSLETFAKEPAKFVEGLSAGSRAVTEYIAKGLSQPGNVAMAQ